MKYYVTLLVWLATVYMVCLAYVNTHDCLGDSHSSYSFHISPLPETDDGLFKNPETTGPSTPRPDTDTDGYWM